MHSGSRGARRIRQSAGSIPLDIPLISLAKFGGFSYARGVGADPGFALPKPSLPMRLALLVAGTTLPLIIFAAGIAYNNYEQDRKDATQRVLETVRGIRLVLDAEMQRMTGGLQVLSLTNDCGTATSKDSAASPGFLEQYGKDGVVLVADRQGRQLFSSNNRTPPPFRCATTLTLSKRSSRPRRPPTPTCSPASVKKS